MTLKEFLLELANAEGLSDETRERCRSEAEALDAPCNDPVSHRKGDRLERAG